MPNNKVAMPNKRRKGLTLIEVLVIIAILSIVAAILYPMFAKIQYNNRVAYAKSHGLPVPPSPFKESHSDEDALRQPSTDDSHPSDGGSGVDTQSATDKYQRGFADGYNNGHAAGFADGLKAGQGSRL